VSGKVILDGKPLKGRGTVTFEGSKGGVSTLITSEGTYSLPDAPVGPVRITLGLGWSTDSGNGVVPSGPPPKKAPKKVVAPAKPVKNIPEKYTNPQTSGLTYTVKPGEQTFDIVLHRE
jgi:hypothetical protein